MLKVTVSAVQGVRQCLTRSQVSASRIVSSKDCEVAMASHGSSRARELRRISSEATEVCAGAADADAMGGSLQTPCSDSCGAAAAAEGLLPTPF